MKTSLRWALVLGTLGVILAVGAPSGVTPEAWRLFAIFAATIVGSIVRPVPAGAVVFLGVVCVALTNALPPAKALGGYADPLVWLVLSAMFLSRGILKTGLGRRIAFLFIRAIGQSSLGLVYALTGTDVLLATFLPSNSARAGGVIFPITRSLAEAYDSHPGPTARRLGAYLLFTVYQCDVIACAAFLTGKVSNVIAAKFAHDVAHVDLTWSRWALGASLPALVALLFVPWLLFRLYPPEITKTPDAARMAAAELERLGPMNRGEKIMLAVFVGVAGLWMTSTLHHIDYTVVALVGVSALFLTGVLAWDDITGERAAWDVFLWYGGLVRMAGALGEGGLTVRFAQAAASHTAGLNWTAALAVLVAIYVFAHYGFASITAHITAMFTPFLVVLLAAGAPPLLAVLLLSYFSNLGAATTHFGTTTAPIYFGANYVSQRDWWRLGFIVLLATTSIFSVVGLAWWKLLGWL
ncbi:MAG: DASS family sodium-coupled anion symporter [Gemmatimonadetes bacterium]|nr:DASS family sodium-coupled anion symporter [Gemmatimonadota bacterium]